MDRKLELKEFLDRSWLIQRLHKPSSLNPFAFGGGYKNGGLTDKASEVIKDIFSFDYMGAAEFEYGAVPQALSFLAQMSEEEKLTTGILSLGKNENIYYLCPCPYQDDVKKRISDLRKNKCQLKEYCGLDSYFDSDSEYSKKNVGWLELDNGFAFFVDKEMFEKFCALFGIQQKKSAA